MSRQPLDDGSIHTKQDRLIHLGYRRRLDHIGYEVSFTRHYYKPLRTLAEISPDILATKSEAENVLDGPFKGISR